MAVDTRRRRMSVVGDLLPEADGFVSDADRGALLDLFYGNAYAAQGDYIEVFPGDDLVAIYAATGFGDTVYLHRNADDSKATFDIGTEELVPGADGVKISGPAPERTLVDLARGVYAIEPWVEIVGTGGRIFNFEGIDGAGLEHIEFRGARYDGADQTTGRGVNRGTNLTLYRCLIRDCDNQGLGNWAGEMIECELTDLSAAVVSGVSAASKSPEVHAIKRSYVHDNHYYALWSDCDNAGFTAEDNVVFRNFASGIFYEISRGPGAITGNLIWKNNTGNVAGRGGLIVTSSKNATISDNQFANNLIQNFLVREDSRYANGANGCSSGYWLEGIVCDANERVYGPVFRLNFHDQSSIQVTADGTHANPDGSAPAGADVEYTNGDYTPETNTAPTTPTAAADPATTTAALTSSAFADDDWWSLHEASQWQVTLAADTDFSDPVVDSGEDTTNLLAFSATGLTAGTDYIARVRHMDDSADGSTEWSEWSAAVEFSTGGPDSSAFSTRIDDITNVASVT